MADRDIIARLKLSGTEFAQELKTQFDKVPQEAERAGSEAGARFSSGFGLKLAGLAVAGASAVAVVSEIVGKSLDLGKSLDETSRSLNVNVESLQEWRHAAREVGASTEELDASLGTLNGKIRAAHDGNREAQQSFVDLGVGFETVNGRARETDAVFVDVIDRLSRISDPTKRAEMATKLLGEEFDRLAPMAEGGARGLDDLEQSARDLGVALSAEEIKGLNDTNRKLEEMRDILSVRIAGIVAENADSIGYLTDKILGLAAASVKGAADYLRFNEAVNERSKRYFEINAQKGLSSEQRAAAKAKVDRELGFVNRPASGILGALGGVESQYVGPRKPADYFGIGSMLDMAGKARSAANDAAATPFVSPKSTRSPGGSSRKSAEEREAERAAKARASELKRAWEQEERLREETEKTIREQEDSLQVARVRASQGEIAAAQEEARLSFERQHPEVLAKSTVELAKMLGISGKLTEEQEKQLQGDLDRLQVAKKGAVDAAAAAALKKQQEEARRIEEQAEREFQRQREQNVRDLAYLYEDLFTGGVDRIWKDFKSIGLRVIAEVAAQWTLATISGQSINVGQALQTGFGASPLGSLFNFGSTVFGTAANDNQPSAKFQAAFSDLSDLGIGNILPGDQPVPSGAGAVPKSSLLDQAGIAIAASSVSQLLGIGGGGTGGQIGSLAGSVGGQALGSSIAALGSFGGPIGAVAGAVIGSLVGGLFKKTKKGISSIGGSGDTLSILSTRGNSSSREQASVGLAGTVLDSIQQIAETLGADVDASKGAVSIGVRKSNYRVDPTGQGNTKTKYGVLDFGADEQAAVEAAVRNLIEDGVLSGISQASLNILKSGQDLEKAIEKAALIESVPKLLKQRLDPLGYALDEIDAKFRDLADALEEGGASAEQIAQARQLWQLEREDTIKQIGEASATLKDFLSSLTVGADSPLSLRQQETAAKEALQPFLDQINEAQAARDQVDQLKASGASAEEIATAEEAARIAAGKIDQSGFQDAASTYLSVERGINASSGSFFAEFDRIRQLTGNAISLVDAGTTAVDAATSDPFSSAIAASTNDTANILSDQTTQLNEIIAQLKIANDNWSRSGALQWLSDNRNYT